MISAIAWVVAFMLGLLAARRLYSLLGALRSACPSELPKLPSPAPPILLLAPMRNEAQRVAILLDALQHLDYPAERLLVVLGDDASTDATAEIQAAWAEGRPNVRLVRSTQQQGKAALLNEMLARSESDADLVAVYDAKHGPSPDALTLLAMAMQDTSSACVSGYLQPSNARASLVSRYAALESWVTQLVHHEGKERQGANAPSIGGNCLYRRSVLAQIGGFPAGAFSEDTQVSLAMQALGFRTRFLSRARASTLMVETLPDFWRQRLRWNAGLRQAQGRAKSAEGLATALGYVDRLLLLASVALALAGHLPLWVPLGYLATPVVMVLLAIFKAKAAEDLPAISLAFVLMGPVDLAVSAWSVLGIEGIRWR